MLHVPKKVGGRYSVFSNVGLFPLGFLGINIKELRNGAGRAKRDCLKPFQKNPAMLSAALIFHHNKKGMNIFDTFVFDTELESIGKWYRQLMGESIGKENDREGKKINAGITPTVSIGSTDLHSMAQLYLGGPPDRYTSFITVPPNNKVSIPKWKEYNTLVENIQGRKLNEIMDAIINGVKTAYKSGKRPFSEISMESKSEKEMGYLLQFKMMEMMFLAALLNVNAFDQPAVEEYKKETRRILAEQNG